MKENYYSLDLCDTFVSFIEWHHQIAHVLAEELGL